MIARASVAATLVALTAATALATDLPAGYGVNALNGSKFTTTLSNAADNDDFAFDGFAGTTVNATVKASKKTLFSPKLQLIRPDGQIVPDAELQRLKSNKNGSKQQLRANLDESGRWKLCVLADDAVNSSYTVTVKYSGAKSPKIKNPPTSEGQFVFLVPASGEGKLGFKFNNSGTAPTFVSLVDSTAREVDGVGDAVATKKKVVQLKGFTVLPVGHPPPPGDFTLTFANNDGTAKQFKPSFKAKKQKKHKAKTDGHRPLLESLSTDVGGPGTGIQAIVQNLVDENDPNGLPRMFIDDLPLELVPLIPGDDMLIIPVTGCPNVFAIRGEVSGDILAFPIGTVFNISIETSTGQPIVSTDAFTHVSPPEVTTIKPAQGSSAGGFPTVITGEGFRDIQSPRILINNRDAGVIRTMVTPTEVHFNAPPCAQGFVRFGIEDRVSELSDSLTVGSFEYLATPGINRIVPGLIPVLVGDDVFINGAFFSDTDKVFLETVAGAGTFDELTLTQSTFQDENLHHFTAPICTEGQYEIYVEDAQGIRTNNVFRLAFFKYAAITSTSVTVGPNGDQYDGITTTLSNYEGAHILRKDGDGVFEDVTATVMVVVTQQDDWRTDRIRLANANEDSFPDTILVTNSQSVLSNDKSHVRILLNERRNSSAKITDRIFTDATVTLFAPIRTNLAVFGGQSQVSDNWGGLDMWVGAVDIGGGPPEILILHDELKEDLDKQCGNYCTSPSGPGALYNMYWGAS